MRNSDEPKIPQFHGENVTNYTSAEFTYSMTSILT